MRAVTVAAWWGSEAGCYLATADGAAEVEIVDHH
jgi:hypothetical protein